jgi:hypothetical protein
MSARPTVSLSASLRFRGEIRLPSSVFAPLTPWRLNPCRFHSPSPPLAGKFLRPREREKVPAGRLRVMGIGRNPMAVGGELPPTPNSHLLSSISHYLSWRSNKTGDKTGYKLVTNSPNPPFPVTRDT